MEMKKIISRFSASVFVLTLITSILFPLVVFATYTWTESRPAGDFDKEWKSVASDSDGTNLIAGVENGRLYTSANSGSSWTERQPAGDSDLGW